MILLRSRLNLVAGTLIGVLALLLFSNYILPVKYSSTLEFSYNSYIEENDLTVIKNSIDNEVVRAGIINDAIKNSTLNLKFNDIAKNLLITLNFDSNTIKVHAETEDPMISANICNAFSPFIFKSTEDVVAGKNLGDYGVILDRKIAVESTKPSSPILGDNLVFGGFVGLVVTFTMTIVQALLNDTIDTKEELEEVVSVPVFGEIPDCF